MNREIVRHHRRFPHIDVRELRPRHSVSPVVAWLQPARVNSNHRYFLLITSPYVTRKRHHVVGRPLFRLLLERCHLQAIKKTQGKNKTILTLESLTQRPLGTKMVAAWCLEDHVSEINQFLSHWYDSAWDSGEQSSIFFFFLAFAVYTIKAAREMNDVVFSSSCLQP